MNRISRGLSSLLILSPIALVGCSANQSVLSEGISCLSETDSLQIAEARSPVVVQPESRLIETNSVQIFDELLIIAYSEFSKSNDQYIKAPGPELVAGDWLAWECAMVVEYWDMPLAGVE
ncbi:MAG: hypothetical protein P1U42_12300 [Phycisphaerales bacterium]|nr:hypothetical protein [Phycisphaerales bacterium]